MPSDSNSPEHFLHKRGHIREGRFVREVRQAVFPDDAIDLCLSFALDFWVEQHGEEERAQCGHGLHMEMRISATKRWGRTRHTVSEPPSGTRNNWNHRIWQRTDTITYLCTRQLRHRGTQFLYAACLRCRRPQQGEKESSMGWPFPLTEYTYYFPNTTHNDASRH